MINEFKRKIMELLAPTKINTSSGDTRTLTHRQGAHEWKQWAARHRRWRQRSHLGMASPGPPLGQRYLERGSQGRSQCRRKPQPSVWEVACKPHHGGLPCWGSLRRPWRHGEVHQESHPGKMNGLGSLNVFISEWGVNKNRLFLGVILVRL